MNLVLIDPTCRGLDERGGRNGGVCGWINGVLNVEGREMKDGGGGLTRGYDDLIERGDGGLTRGNFVVGGCGDSW